MNREQFYDIIDEAIKMLPGEFREALDNIEIMVKNIPGDEADKRFKRGGMLLGLYTGVPRTKRGAGFGTGFYSLAQPDRIYLYQKNIQEYCRFSGKMPVEQIMETLFHEIGHYMGLNEEELKDLKYRWIKE